MLNRLAGSEVLSKDMLFATLDTTTRRIDLPDGQPLLLTDTVGFVRNLPHRLVEAFKATLEESVLADFLIHVLDASSPEVERFHETTLSVLAELGAGEKKIITVLNKIDQVDDPEQMSFLRRTFPDAIHASALKDLGIEALLDACSSALADRVRRLRYRIPPGPRRPRRPAPPRRQDPFDRLRGQRHPDPRRGPRRRRRKARRLPVGHRASSHSGVLMVQAD